MKILQTEAGLKGISLFLSLLFHVLLLMIVIPVETIEIEQEPVEYSIPVQMQITEVPPPPPPKKEEEKPAVSQQQTKEVAERANTKAATEPEPEKPTRLPGDRDNPEVSDSYTPVYPKTALNEGWAGTVTVDFNVDEKGKVIGHKIVKSSGHDILDTTFIRTVQTYYKFKPKRVLGEDVKGTIRLSYTFKTE